jgi:hypothetical protein
MTLQRLCCTLLYLLISFIPLWASEAPGDVAATVFSPAEGSFLEDRARIFKQKAQWDAINDKLKSFNQSRTDNLMFSVITQQDWILVQEDMSHVKLEDLPGGVVDVQLAFRGLNHEAYAKVINMFKVYEPRMVRELAREFPQKNPMIVYVYHQIRFYNAKKKYKEYTVGTAHIIADHDEIDRAVTLKIQQQANKGWEPLKIKGRPTRATPAPERIDIAVKNIINAIQLEYDNNGATGKGIVDCGPLVNEKLQGPLIEHGSELEQFETLVQTGANLLDHHTADQQYKSPHLIIDQPRIFRGNSIQNVGPPVVYNKILSDAVFYDEILPDILNNIQGKYTIKVVSFSTNGLIIPNAQRQEFAEAVYTAAQVTQAPNTVLILLPYYKCNAESNPDEYSSWLMMPCAYSPDKAMTTLMNNALMGASIRDGLTQAIQQVPKRCRVYIWNLLWNGDAVSIQPNDKTGEPFIFEDATGRNPVEVIVLQDTRLERILDTKKKCTNYLAFIALEERPDDPRPAECYAHVNNDINRILAEPPAFKQVKENSNLRLSAINWAVSRDFVMAYGAMKLGGKIPMSDDLFYGGDNTVNRINAALVFSLIDASGALLSLAGLDFVTDAIGAYVSLQVNDMTNAGLYSTAMAIPVLNGAALRKVMQGIEIVAQAGKAGYKTVARTAMHGLFYLKVATTDLSEFARFALKPAVQAEVRHFAKEIPTLLSDIERLSLDANYLSKISDNPYLIEDYARARKADPELTLQKYVDLVENGTIARVAPIGKTEWEAVQNGEWLFVYAEGVTKEVASSYLDSKGLITMEIDVMIGPNKSAVARGGDVFNTICQEMEKKYGADRIKGMQAIWVNDPMRDTNLKAFNEGIQFYKGQGMDNVTAAREAAKNKTFTGAMAKKNEFTEVKELEGHQYPDGHFDDVAVTFLKKEKTPPTADYSRRLVLTNGTAAELEKFAASVPPKDGYYDLFSDFADDKFKLAGANVDPGGVHIHIMSRAEYKTGMPLRIVLKEPVEITPNGQIQKLVNMMGMPCEVYNTSFKTTKTVAPNAVLFGTYGRDMASAYNLMHVEGRLDIMIHGDIDGFLSKKLRDGSFVDISIDDFLEELFQHSAWQAAMRLGKPFDVLLLACETGASKTAKIISQKMAARGFTGRLIAADVVVAVLGSGEIVTSVREGGQLITFSRGKEVLGLRKPIPYSVQVKTTP